MVTRVVMKNNEFMADGVGKGKVAGNMGVKISKGRLEDRSYLSNLQSSSIQTEMETSSEDSATTTTTFSCFTALEMEKTYNCVDQLDLTIDVGDLIEQEHVLSKLALVGWIIMQKLANVEAILKELDEGWESGY